MSTGYTTFHGSFKHASPREGNRLRSHSLTSTEKVALVRQKSSTGSYDYQYITFRETGFPSPTQQKADIDEADFKDLEECQPEHTEDESQPIEQDQSEFLNNNESDGLLVLMFDSFVEDDCTEVTPRRASRYKNTIIGDQAIYDIHTLFIEEIVAPVVHEVEAEVFKIEAVPLVQKPKRSLRQKIRFVIKRIVVCIGWKSETNKILQTVAEITPIRS